MQAAALRSEWETLIAGPADTAILSAARRLGLDAADLLVLACAVAPYVDTAFRQRFCTIQGSVLADRCSVGLATRLLASEPAGRMVALERFAPERPLFRAGLVTVESSPDSRGDARIERVLCVPQRTVDLVLGSPRLDERVRPYCVIEQPDVPLDRVVVPERQRREVVGLVRHHEAYRRHVHAMGFDRAIPWGRGIVLLFAGPPGTGKTLFARARSHVESAAAPRPLRQARRERRARRGG